MRSTLLSCVLFLTTTAIAQTPIATARTAALGTAVTVRGVITNGSELGGVRYIQDATGGLALFPGSGSVPGFNPTRGSDVTVTGTLKSYYGLLELDPISSFTVNSTSNPLPAPLEINPAQIGESNEAELVRLNGCQFTNGGATFTSNTWSFTSNGQSAVIFLRSGHPLIGTTIPAGPVDIIGITSQYSTATPPSGGYQVLPRDANDLLVSTMIAQTSAVVQTGILPDGFTLEWTTNIAGSSQVAYGTTPALGNFTSSGGSSTVHAVPITGLQPATAYYARTFSVHDQDTAWSSLGLYSTASASPGTVKVHFNRPVDASVAIGTPASSLGNAIDDTVRAYIDRADLTVDYAVYNTTTSSIVSALNNARNRGVQVRVIAEGSNSNSALDGLNATIPVLLRTDGQGSGMHNKFIVIDAENGPAAHVLTGSTNCTNASFFVDANNLVVIQDQAMARCYRTEFEEMWGGAGPQPNTANSRFGSEKTDNTPHWFNVGGTLIESRFSPSDGTMDRIGMALSTADATIEFALFALTADELTLELIAAQANGVTVRGMLEEDDMSVSDLQALLNGNVDARPDGDPGSYLHHKYAIIDRAGPAALDPLVITGSHNWSYNAENLNDENTVFIHSAELADHFHQEWHARWTTAVGITETDADNGLSLWPNPVTTALNITWAMGDGPVECTVSDAAGRSVVHGTIAGSNGSLDLHALAPGTYFLLLQRADVRAVRRFVRR
ncbi:MAG: phospholipase D-like domain-containing protein [Flavobacteriales bacterium]